MLELARRSGIEVPETKLISPTNIAGLPPEFAAAGAAFAIRRIAFNATIGNGDMHLKNLSLIYRNGRDPELAPAYDYVSTLVYPSLDHCLALSFGDSKEPDIYQRDRIRRFAQTAELPVKLIARDIADTIERTHAAWHGATDLPMREEHRAIVGAHIDRFAAAASRSE